MLITHKLQMDLARRSATPRVDAVQGDENTRAMEIALYENGNGWNPPEGVSVAISYRKPDGTSGLYDTLPDGGTASGISENTVRFIMVPQMLTVPGLVEAAVILTGEAKQVSTFPFQILVTADPGAGAVKSENYYHYTTFTALNEAIGNLEDLQTTDKSSLVAAINEAAKTGGSGTGSGQTGSDGFSPVATVEQTAEGAVITITDKDGTTTATVIHGKDGAKGDTGAPDIGQVFAPSPQLAGRAVTVVNSIDEMTDRTRQYALDGYIYQCVATEVSKGYTNQLAVVGWQEETRISSSGEIKAASGVDIDTSGLIPAVPGDRLRINAVKTSMNYATYIAAYDAGGAKTGMHKLSDAVAATATSEIDMELTSATFGAFTGIRFCSGDINSETVATINEPIGSSTETVYNWVSTGEAHTPSDFDAEACTAQNIDDYMGILCANYPNYIVKETMGKDESGQFDCNRYVLSAHYYSAWQKTNYPKMYGWKNGSKVIYSRSVSPRIGDTMYSTACIGTAYSTVTAVDNANQSRTVNGETFSRYSAGDAEPTLAFVSVVDDAAGSGIVYDETAKAIATVSGITAAAMSDSKGNSYTRYPLGDRRKDMTRPTVVVIGANEHGPQGDPKEPAIICARLAKDLCECRKADNWMLRHLKNTCMVVLVPVINPYGFTYGDDESGTRYGYYNANSVNINRNYDCRGFGLETNAGPCGAYGGSENETQYFMNTISEPGAAVAISIHCLGYTSGANDGLMHYQGNGFNADKLAEIAQAIKVNYNLRLTSYSDAPLDTTAKSPTYITQAGAVGGIIEMQAREGKLGEDGAALHTARIMEANYTLLLQCVHMWLTDYEEADSSGFTM